MDNTLITYRWRFLRVDDPEVSSTASIERIQDIFLDGFGQTQIWSGEKIAVKIRKNTVVGFLEGTQERAYGYAMYFVPEVPLQSSFLLWEDAICLRKQVHGQGFTSLSLLKSVCKFLARNDIGWVGGRAQNPLMFRRYTSFGETFPFNISYTSSLGQCVMQHFLNTIPRGRSTETLDQKTGVWHNAYESRLGDYPVQVKGTEEFESLLTNCGFDRNKGDAVVVIARVNDLTNES